MNFALTTEKNDAGTAVIALTGEVDLYTAPELKSQMLELIANGADGVVVDFTNTTFIDSTTLGVLVSGVKRLREKGGTLSIVCSDRNITKIFERSTESEKLEPSLKKFSGPLNSTIIKSGLISSIY